MVRGIDKFKAFFKDFENAYVIIGGTACEIHEENYAQTPRVTKDIDIILVVEALSSDFVSHFWEFVKAGGYEQRNKGTNDDAIRRRLYFNTPSPLRAGHQFPIMIFPCLRSPFSISYT